MVNKHNDTGITMYYQSLTLERYRKYVISCFVYQIWVHQRSDDDGSASKILSSLWPPTRRNFSWNVGGIVGWLIELMDPFDQRKCPIKIQFCEEALHKKCKWSWLCPSQWNHSQRLSVKLDAGCYMLYGYY